MKLIKHIGVLTSGGDAPGMNAAIRAVVRTAIAKGVKTSGIYHGYNGLVKDEVKPLTMRDVSYIISRGGTMLKSSRSDEFRTKEGRERAHEVIIKHGLDALIVIGGDGSMTGAKIFQEEFDVPVIGIPGTIDNDIFGTDFTIGFDTAVNVAMECIDKIRDTASSHDRLFLVEVMGRDTGHIALRTALASGAVAVLVPEGPMSINELHEHLAYLESKNKSSNIIIVAEGNPTGNAFEVAQKLEALQPSYETRVSVIGHIQRGGSPSAADRVLAAELGTFAVESLLEGARGVMVGVIDRKMVRTPIEEAINQRNGLNEELLRISDYLSV